MKTYFFIIVCSITIFLKAQNTDYLQMKQLVDSGYYTIVVDRAMPMSGAMINLTSLYSIDFYKDSINCYLPYFGRSYGGPVPINSMYGGIRPQTKIQDLKMAFNEKKKKATIEFSAVDQNTSDRYRFFITVFSGTSASISIVSNYRQNISFSGYITTLKN